MFESKANFYREFSIQKFGFGCMPEQNISLQAKDCFHIINEGKAFAECMK